MRLESFRNLLVHTNSADEANSSTVYGNENLSSLGLTSGTSYSWAAGPDIIQINVGPASGGGTSAVPEASTSLGLLGLAAGGILTRRRSKRAA